jgi:hypothetical protein
MKRVLDFFVYSNVLISIVATYIYWGTCNTFHLTFDRDILIFILCATGASYNLHWYFTNDKNGDRNLWNRTNKKIIGTLFIIYVLISGLLLLRHISWIPFMLPTICLTLIYSAPKFPIKFLHRLQGKALAKTFYLSFVWTFTTCLLPFLISDSALNYESIFYIITQFVFFYIICLLFDYKDRHEEKIPFLFIDTNRHIVKIILLLMIAPITTLIILPNTILIHQLSISFLLSYWFILFTLPTSLNTKNDYWFYGLLDSWMAAPLLIHQIIQLF